MANNNDRQFPVPNEAILDRFDKLRKIYDLISYDMNRYYGIMLNDKSLMPTNYNDTTLEVLKLAKEKITELEKEINNATSKTTDAQDRIRKKKTTIQSIQKNK